MGITKKRGNTNLMVLRSNLNKLNISSEESKQKDDTQSDKQLVNAVGKGSVGATMKEAKKRGRRANELIDGSRLLTC